MKHRTRRIVTAVLSSVVFQSLLMLDSNRWVATAQDQVAIVAITDGRVRLRRKGLKSKLQRTSLLNAGDIVDPEKDTRAVLYQAYAPVSPLIADQSRTIAELSPPPPQNALTAEEYARLKRILIKAETQKSVPSPKVMGAQNATALSLVERRNSTVLERERTFSWTPVEGATSYAINVYDRDKKLVWSSDTPETRTDFPTNLRLAPGNYQWEVTAKIDNKTQYDPALYDANTFTIVSSLQAAEIEADLTAARSRLAPGDGMANLVYISALMEHKRWSQAEVELKASLERAPTDQTLWELLMETYMQMELWGARENARLLSEDQNIKAIMIRDLKAQR
jgi:hypothetical protein